MSVVLIDEDTRAAVSNLVRALAVWTRRVGAQPEALATS